MRERNPSLHRVRVPVDFLDRNRRPEPTFLSCPDHLTDIETSRLHGELMLVSRAVEAFDRDPVRVREGGR
jgi:hypothetical protein